MSVKEILIEFANLSGGKNSTDPPHALAPDQCVETLNFIHDSSGIRAAPGYVGVSAAQLFDNPILAFCRYIKASGAQTAIAISNGSAYSVDYSTGTKTSIGSFAGAGSASWVNAAGKLWVANGTSFSKVESDNTVKRVQLLAPTTGVSSVQAGGTLPNGVYGVYFAYARKDSYGRYLYSLPQALSAATLTTGNNTVRVTFTASTDPQVTHGIVFMTDGGGTVHYYYGEVANATGVINITSSSGKLSSVKMLAVSSGNQILPIVPDSVYAFGDKLFCWKNGENTVYWSLKTDINAFDLERFPAENTLTLMHPIHSIFSVGGSLYFNHVGIGITVAVNGDLASAVMFAVKGLWFLPCKTSDGTTYCEYYKGLCYGITNDGVRSFDGVTFSNDLSSNIKADFDKSLSSAFVPAMAIYRRPGNRTELRISFNNTDYSSTGNNDQLIMNLDNLLNQMESKQCWERWENGFSFYSVFGNKIVFAQNGADTKAHIVIESGASDMSCYNRVGEYMASSIFMKQRYVLSRMIISALDAVTVWGGVYHLLTSGGEITGNVIVFDENNTKYHFSLTGAAPTLAILPSEASGLGLELPFIMAPQYPIVVKRVLPFSAKGKAASIEISQTEDDPNLFLYKLQLMTKQIRSNIT